MKQFIDSFCTLKKHNSTTNWLQKRGINKIKESEWMECLVGKTGRSQVKIVVLQIDAVGIVLHFKKKKQR